MSKRAKEHAMGTMTTKDGTQIYYKCGQSIISPHLFTTLVCRGV